MAFISKRKKKINEKVEFGKVYNALEACNILKEVSSVKFDETVEVAVNLGVDSRKTDQVVRGSTVLPKGTGQTVRVAVFAQGPAAEAAKAAGAEIVGMEDLAESIKAGNMDFDVVIASPDAMRIVGTLGQVLGPRGLMPNPKVGTVSPNVGEAVKNAKAGQVRYRTDKAGIIHSPLGKISFAAEDLVANLKALIADLQKMRPANAKGVYLKKVTITSTMGPGLVVENSSVV